MKGISKHFLVCLLSIPVAYVASAQSPALAPSPDQAGAQPARSQTLSQKIATDCGDKRRLAIRAVNLRYIDLTLDAVNLFTKENNQARATDASTWIKNLAWANEANLKGVNADAKDRLGELQTAYLKERVNAIISADTACVNDVESATKQAIQGGDQASAVELAKLEDRIKQELRSVQPAAAPPAPATAATTGGTPPPAEAQPAAPSIPPAQVVAQFSKARADAVKTVNQKYARNAKMAAGLFHDNGNDSRADDANDWATRLDSTDDAVNLKDLAPGMNDRLGSLQQSYVKDRAAAALAVDKAWFATIQASEKATNPESDMKGAMALQQVVQVMCKELGLAPPPRIAVARTPPPTTNPGYTPAPSTSQPAARQTDPSHPFGVEADKVGTDFPDAK